MSSQLQNIPKGDKQTEIGVIPEDWRLCEFKNIIAKIIDYRGVTPKKLGMDWGGGEICALSANNVQMGFVDFEKECHFASEKLYRRWMRNGDCEVGDILLTMEAPLGNVAYIPDKKKYILSQRTILIKPHKDIKKSFLRYFMSGNYFQKSLLDNATGTTALGIQRKKLEKIFVYFPIKELEQSAIAESLSDINKLIDNLEKQIEKKKAIKQGTMQELLTGKKRLPGFSEKWKENKLDEIILKITTGLNPRKNFRLGEGDNYYVTIKNFRNEKLFLDEKCDNITNFARLLINKRSNLEKGDILFASIGIEPSTYLIKTTPKDWNINESVFSIKPNNKIIDSRYLQYLLTADWIFEHLASDATGSTFQSIKVKQLINLELIYPKLEEQQKIADILSDMDSEIGGLEKKRDKYVTIKQGMMQQLLTGKIRIYGTN